MKKILVVEDEIAYSRLLHDQLTTVGYQVVLAEDGERGLSMVKSEKPDLVLLDIKLPKMDGMAMLDLLRKEPNGKTIKVIILTNLEPDDKIIREVTEDLPTYYCIKSDTKLDDLLEKIKSTLSDKPSAIS